MSNLPSVRLAPFEPNWQQQYGKSGIYLPDNLNERSPHPTRAPRRVRYSLSGIYQQVVKYDVVGLDFVGFPKLPTEIRRAIWKFSLPGPRLVEVFYDESTNRCTSPCPLPTALQANQESKSVALYHFKPCFGTTAYLPIDYFDMRIDQLYLGLGNISPHALDPYEMFFRAISHSDRRSLENLVVDFALGSLFPPIDDTDDEDDGGDEEAEEEEEDFKFGLPDNLVTITIICEDGDEDVVLTKAPSRNGEFQVWDINRNGRPRPWQWPISRKSKRFENAMSCFWANLETNFFTDNENYLLETARFVSRKRLAHHPMWAKRVRFMENSVRAYTGCLFPKDGVIDRLVKMEAKHPLTYGGFTLTISNDLPEGRFRDPSQTYVGSHQCICPVQHDDRYSPIEEPSRSISSTALRLAL